MTREQRQLSSDMRAAIDMAAERAAKRAAKDAIKQTFLSLGIDSETPTEVRESQKDQAFLRSIRLFSESKPAKAYFAMFGAFLSLTVALIVFSIQRLFGMK